MGYEWITTALAALVGVEAYEVLQALGADRKRPVPASSEGVRLLTLWSRSGAGRPLIVTLRHKSGLDWWIVGARDMKPDELAEFEAWEAK
ncbi:MAG: hypothetical protein ACRDT8_16220 [Micromonosporaceae bacterium]